MKLKVLTRKNTWWIRQAAELAKAPIGPIAVMRYRPDFFGRHYALLFRDYLEKPKYWVKGETELFAAFVSRLNRCEF